MKALRILLMLLWLPLIVIGGFAALICLGLEVGFKLVCQFVITANEEAR